MTTPQYSLERHLSIQDIRDAPPLTSPTTPLRYAAINSRQYRRAPQRFYIETDSGCSNHRLSCQPGSIFQGKVKVELAEPLMCLHLKLIFKGEEKIATHGKLQHKLVDNRIFAVRTLLWGIHQHDDTLREAWPILESGHHEFSFMVEMPLVNYPPSFFHPYVSCDYTLFASLERPGERPFQTQHITLDFTPIVTLTRSTLIHQPSPPHCPIHQKIPIPTTTLTMQLVIPQHSFTLPQTTTIPIRLDMSGTSQTPITIRAKLQRLVKVTHTTMYQEDSTTLGRVEKTWDQGHHHGLDLQLPLPPDLHPTMDYSKKFRIQYYIVVSAKLRPSSRLSASTKKKQSITVPIHLATLGQEIKPPAALVPFTHPDILADDTMLTKPRFLPPPSCHSNYPPPYDPNDTPPAYLLA
ncbi:hypothetical protein BC941DRAFT_470908 [Chlamydoabsidia padenii]|nr:hypothetical protein BC941DRAFT_470908 [Chlamydoabsidia padenii]